MHIYDYFALLNSLIDKQTTLVDL